MVRPLVNVAARWIGGVMLPQVGAAMELAYLSHVAIDDDRKDVFLALVAEHCRRARPMCLTHLVTGFVADHPLSHALARQVRHRTYDSDLYVAFWPDGEPAVRGLDARLLQPEVAVL